MGEGALAEAGPYLQEALITFDHFDHPAKCWLATQAHADLGGVALLQGDLDAAQQHLGRSLSSATGNRSLDASRFALPFVARLLAQQGQTERAVEIYALASRYPYVANSRWYQDLVGQYMESVGASLPPEVREAAQARGRARDLSATAEELATTLNLDISETVASRSDQLSP